MNKYLRYWVLAAAMAIVASSCTVWTWGYNGSGQVGNGTTTNSNVPVDIGDQQIAIAAGGQHSCRITESRTLECWGKNTEGQLGDGTTTDRSTPTQVGTATNWQSVSANGSTLLLDTSSTCAIRTDQTLWCWGDNTFGQLGQGDTTDRSVPTQVGSASDWRSVSVGGAATCGIRGSRGFLWCWGGSIPGSTAAPNSPTQIGTSDGYLVVALGLAHGCLLLDPGELYCWGENEDGQVGDGTTTDRRNPTRIGTERDWIRLGLGAANTCGIRGDKTLWCWGSNASGQIGDGTTTERHTPTQVGSATDWFWIASGGSRFPPPFYVEQGHTCGIRAGGSLWCWGFNVNGELGDGTNTNRTTPVQVGLGTTWTAVEVGESHTVGLANDP